VGSIANAYHWRRLAQAFSGQPARGHACSLDELRAVLERAGLCAIETRPVNVEGDESAEELKRFLEASVPLTATLGIEPEEFANRCRATHYLVRAVRTESGTPASTAQRSKP
jgi:hypothetical protein